MLSANQRIPRRTGGSLQPVLPLVCETIPSSEEERSQYISFELRARVGAPDASTKYKKYVRKFEEGTPQMWIDLVKDMTEIWTQNSMAGGTDRASTARALIRGKSLTAFEAALQLARTGADGIEAAITPENVATSLAAVAETVFPHRALETQKLWMNRSMFKPRAMTTRLTSAVMSRINNALPLFPTGVDTSKFTEPELVGLLEWSLPPAWREKFDLKGYIPSEFSRTRLVTECEAIERHLRPDDGNSNNKTTEKTKSPKKRGRGENSNTRGDRNSGNKKTKFFCTEHGNNPTHPTSECWTLKNRDRENSGSNKSRPNNSNRSFSNKSFRKELHLLSKKSSKKEVLDLYAGAIQKE